MDLKKIAHEVSGKLFGQTARFRGIFTTLGGASRGDIVIRHWIDENGVKIALKKGVCCLITQDPRGHSLKLALEAGIPVIVVDRIEIANAFALSWTLKHFTESSRRIVVTGTNGKSTTTHLIHHIITSAGKIAYTNTDSRSEFNTLIDPVVSEQIARASAESDIEFLVIEVSEVQGWLGRVMRDHAYLMTSAIEPEIVVITNVAMDHIGLVDSIEDVFHEISGAVKALRSGTAVLNCDDERVKAMGALNNEIDVSFYGSGCRVSYGDDGIYCGDELIVSRDRIPFRSEHFIQNTLAAVATCLKLGFSNSDIERGVSTYKPLKRRFSIIRKRPLVVDDFAHNPDGIKSTIKSAAAEVKGQLWIVNAIRGSRGEEINILNAGALAEALNEISAKLIVTSSSDVVDAQNTVTEGEREAFLRVLNDSGIAYIYVEKLGEALQKVFEAASEEDTVLLLGAQGMDPASELIKGILR